MAEILPKADQTVALESYTEKAGKRLRRGFTTGSCAALAARAAMRMLLGGPGEKTVAVVTPRGIRVEAEALNPARGAGYAECAVRKDAGDDPDVTDGVLVYARVEKIPGCGIVVDGGIGVGRVTKNGLDQPPGNAAINSVPRRMIENEVREACDDFGYDGGIKVVISIPGGEAIAGKTFNPNLGIVGGLSVIGTSGIVEPMSSAALLDAVRVEMRVRRAEGVETLVLTPGNYGEDFLKRFPLLDGKPYVKCSNFIGDALDEASALGFARVLVVGHLGKTVKLSGGVMDTHSRAADCRLELLALQAALAGAGVDTLRDILAAATVDDGMASVDRAGLRDSVMRGLLERADKYLRRRAGDGVAAGVVMFSNALGLLGVSPAARAIVEKWEKR